MGPRIKLLPDNIANQIAAGEVVQRPASIVKEVIENAIDAGATEISLHIKDAGKTFIQITDNGHGMSETDARMCFERHATSKVRTIEDLFGISTFGFRGEAMASIAAVARVEMQTRTVDEEIGTRIIVQDSKVEEQLPCPTAVGTQIVVKNLFFNVPARKNFLKSNNVERKHIVEEFIRAALPNPQISFTFEEDGVKQYQLTKGSTKQRLIQLFGKRLETGLIPVHEETGIVKIEGFITSPELAKKMRGEQYFFANNRFIKSPYFNHALMGAYEGLLMPEHFPLYMLQLSVEPIRLDVNVHPTKTEVKFEDEKSIYAILKTTIKKALSEHHAGPGLSFENEPIVEQSWLRNTPTHSPAPFKNTSTAANSGSYTRPVVDSGFSKPQAQPGNWKDLYNILERQTEEKAVESVQQQTLPQAEEKAKPLFQLGLTYVVTTLQKGLVVVHQRKAHQRILFEHFMSLTNNASSQKLLFADSLQLGLKEYELFVELEDELQNMGFAFAELGKRTVSISAVPADISTELPEKLIQDFFEVYQHSQFTDTLSLKEKVARSLARSASIREGKVLKQEEMSSLIDQLFACEMPYYHFDGTPIIVNITTADLDKKFSVNR
ncbi:MAG: DNA mismatch repair endonuclease MutL [Bacteroidetes bacterium]|nr:DNA mismatch repair endonuclease MutL [Bacteroidota bacterium]